MKDKRWEEMPLENRKVVWEAYRETLYAAEGWWISFEQCDNGWTGSRWMTIKYAFGAC